MQESLLADAPRTISTPTARARLLGWRYFPHAVLALTLLAIFSYTPPRWQDWNQNSRFDLTMALVEHQTTSIDAYASNTGDYATVDGHIYSDKAPGLSLAAVPVYAATRLAFHLGFDRVAQRLGHSPGFAATLSPAGAGLSQRRIEDAVALMIATLVCVSLPAAIMAVLLMLIVERLWGCRAAGLITALVFGLATPVFTYSQAFYSHMPAAVAIVGALAVLVLRSDGPISDRRLAAVGLLLGCAVILDYPAAGAAIPIALWALWLGRQRAVLFGVFGALPPLALLVGYDYAAFGTVLPVGYEHSTLWQAEHQQGFISLTYPKWSAAWGLLGSRFRGLFFYSPVLILALPGIWLGIRRGGRAALLVAVAGFLGVFLLIASSAMWWGGFAVGPRYILPGVPLLAVPFGAAVAWLNARPIRQRLAGLGLAAALAALSVGLVWATTFAGQSYPTDAAHDPLSSVVGPALKAGDVARNAGMVAHLGGLASLLPLAAIVLVGVAVTFLSLVSQRIRGRVV